MIEPTESKFWESIKASPEYAEAVKNGCQEEYLSAIARERTLYIEIAPGSSITSDITHDGWISMRIEGEVTHVSDVPSPDTAVSSEIFLIDEEHLNLESQGDSYVNDPKEDEYRK